MSYYIGVIGNTYSDVSKEKIKKKLNFLIDKAIKKKEKYEDKDFDNKIYIVSGLICLGVTKIIVEIANVANYPVIGIGPEESMEFFKETSSNHRFNRVLYVGKKYGDENDFFIKNIDILICLDGSEQDNEKIRLAKKKNLPTIVYCK